MEKGLVRVMNFFKKKRLKVVTIVTDKHSQINKWLQENHSKVKHYFDVWHVLKGIYITCKIHFSYKFRYQKEGTEAWKN